MRTIAVVNQKGGVGKTTVSINLAASLAREGRRVLLVDMDPQSHCAVGLAVPDEQIELSVVDVLRSLRSDVRLGFEQVTWQITPRLELAASTRMLGELEADEAHREDGTELLRRALEPLGRKYDFAIIDCAPHVGVLMRNALTAATDVIIPVETGYFSLHGLTRQLATIEGLVNGTGRRINVRVLANHYDVRTKLAREILAELRRKFEHVLFSTVINFNTKLKEGTSCGQPITEFAPESAGARDFQMLAREVESGSAAMEPSEAIHALAERLGRETDRLVAARAPLMTRDREPVAAGATRTVARPLVRPSVVPSRPVERVAMPMRPFERVAVPPGLVAQRRETLPAAAGADDLHTRIDAQLAEIYGPRQTPGGVVFRTRHPAAEQVMLAGDFNGWMPHETPLARLDESGVFQATLDLRPGRYRYRLVVDGRWEFDRENPSSERNEYGEVNSIVEVR
ncbi:MAG: AAA family ATPase [Phycisphaerales bacterium]|nr:AAA family ATPase [Phycisphaerales bacterium]